MDVLIEKCESILQQCADRARFLASRQLPHVASHPIQEDTYRHREGVSVTIVCQLCTQCRQVIQLHHLIIVT